MCQLGWDSVVSSLYPNIIKWPFTRPNEIHQTQDQVFHILVELVMRWPLFKGVGSPRQAISSMYAMISQAISFQPFTRPNEIHQTQDQVLHILVELVMSWPLFKGLGIARQAISSMYAMISQAISFQPYIRPNEIHQVERHSITIKLYCQACFAQLQSSQCENSGGATLTAPSIPSNQVILHKAKRDPLD